MSDNNHIAHYGTPRHSGRYPWGSGNELEKAIRELTDEGLSEKEIAKVMGFKSTTELRNQKALAVGAVKEENRIHAIQKKESGMSTAAISYEMNLPESTVRDLLKPHANAKYRQIQQIADKLKESIEKGEYLDVGYGVELYLNTTRPKLDNAITLLKNQGYKLHYVKQEQLGTADNKTLLKVLTGPDTDYKAVMANKERIGIPNLATNKTTGEMDLLPDAISNISSKRVLVKYANDGGGDKDGLIELRQGVPELNLGDRRYAQVRIGVDGTHYMKGMAVIRDDLPDGVDIIYNTSKDPTGNKLDAMKKQKAREIGDVSVFGAVVRPNVYGPPGAEKIGPINIVGDGNPSVEGSWANWNASLASQVVSKQSPRLAKQQLDIVRKNYEAELDDIMSLTNPVVRDHLLIEYADKADRAAIDLKASALPRQTTAVLLPDPKLRPDEIYAPNYNNGEEVVLIRYPHGGVFEIPTLKVNNKYSEYKDIIGSAAPDAVAIHPSKAQALSGADFDGDFVVVIPNRDKQIRTSPSLEALKNFNPRETYKEYPGMKVMSEKQKQRKMGDISNLITDMTIKGANQAEIARAVRHSMVVIDAAKHSLNYEQSYKDNGIAALKTTYQGSARSGAATLISRAKSDERVLKRQDRYAIDPVTGKKVYTNTDEFYVDKKTGKEVYRTQKSTKMAEALQTEAEGAHAIKSKPGTPIETIYADHANMMYGLGNRARKATIDTVATPYSPSARKTYQSEVDSLDVKLKAAVRARPLERKAQIVGEKIYKAKLEANSDMSYADKRKSKGSSLQMARVLLDSTKPTIEITPREWTAIEMGAVSPTKLRQILRNADMDLVRTYATPRSVKAGLSTAKETRAKALIASGYTAAEVASALGVSASVIRNMDKKD